MSTIEDARFLRALNRQPVDKTPVWVMRQAGRYLPEYRQTRKKAGDFLTLCKTPELACEVTLQPLARYDLDAAIVFSDILTIPDAMGLGLYFAEGEGPKFKHPIKTSADIAKLPTPCPETELAYVPQAVRTIARALDGKVPLIGFAGSPWTLACYMTEGGSSKDFRQARVWLYADPDAMVQLLNHLAKVTNAYLKAQVAAGASVVMLFDTWGGLLSTEAYQRFALPSMQTSLEGIDVPTIMFTKSGGQWLELMANTGVNALGLDWTTPIGNARARVGQQVALQGNLDPAILLSSPETIEREVEKILRDYGPHPGHIFNLGHGITPDVPPEHMQVLVDTVHRVSTEVS